MVLSPPFPALRTWLRAQFNQLATKIDPYVTPRDNDGWNDLTDRMQPPVDVLRSFVGRHTEVRSDHLPLLWEAFLQWVRVRGRFDETWYRYTGRRPPPAASRYLCQPSLAVDDLWELLGSDAHAWSELPHSVQAMERLPVREPHDRTNLSYTYAKAYYDEYGPPLPILFRIDELLGLNEGRLHRAECIVNAWGVPLRDCPAESDAGHDPEPGRTCLHEIPWVAIRGDIGGF